MVKKFPTFWKKELKIRNKKGLVVEFLSKVNRPDKGMFSWEIYKEKGINFVNVGIWNSKRDFLREMNKMSKDVKEKMAEFKYDDTIRIWVTPKKIRTGYRKIKKSDAEFVD